MHSAPPRALQRLFTPSEENLSLANGAQWPLGPAPPSSPCSVISLPSLHLLLSRTSLPRTKSRAFWIISSFWNIAKLLRYVSSWGNIVDSKRVEQEDTIWHYRIVLKLTGSKARGISGGQMINCSRSPMKELLGDKAVWSLKWSIWMTILCL